MNVPTCKDMTQEEGLTTPEIRVWCHPPKIGKEGNDYYQTFNSFEEAEEFIKKHKEAEKHLLIAFRGYELDIYGIENR